MSYAKYTEDNIKITQERQRFNVWYPEKPKRAEEYIPYAVRYQIPQPKHVSKVKRRYAYGY